MIGVIADDITGAAELGAVGLRHGLKAEIVLDGPPSGQADLVCVDTDSRFCSPLEAGRRAAEAALRVRRAGASWLYKKVDSVLRGEVTAEVEAILEQLTLKRALLVPANPSLGRTIRQGCYFIRGTPVNETEFARDPRHPRTSPRVLELLSAPARNSLTLVPVHHELPRAGLAVGEAASVEDLRLWAARCVKEVLPVGGAEFFGALLAREGFRAAPLSGSGGASDSGTELFVCGSTSDSSREFVAAQRGRGVPVFSLPESLGRGGALEGAPLEQLVASTVQALGRAERVVLCVGLPLVQDRGVAAGLSSNLVRLAEAVLRRAAVERVYAEGGATAVELAKRLGWTQLTVLRELAPGVARLAVAGRAPLTLTIKPGTYLWPQKTIQAA